LVADGESFIPMPLKVNDKLQIVFTINSNEDQVDIFNSSITTSQRVLVDILISDGKTPEVDNDYL
jgi:hypothetical protein